MADIKTIQISEGVRLNCFNDKCFKTIRISVNMFVPLSHETASKYAVLPSLVSRASERFPDYTALGERLAELYGASIDSGVSKYGGYQVLSLSASGLSNRYAFDGEDMVKELSSLLFSILFTPLKDEEGLFPEDGFLQEQRQLLEIFDAEFNDKILYARKRCTEIAFKGSARGIDRNGTKDSVEALTRQELKGVWEEILQQAKFEIFVLGDCNPDIAFFEEAFSGLGVQRKSELAEFAEGGFKEVTEEMQLSQSKLVMAFKAPITEETKEVYRLMAVVLGGTPSSKFFMNVREKMSLCYYCSARLSTENSLLLIESGIETENIEKAREAILQQLEALKSGDITDDEENFAKLAMCNSFRGVNDSLSAVESWYLTQSFDQNIKSPQEMIDSIMAVTKENIIKAANELTLDTVYILKGQNK